MSIWVVFATALIIMMVIFWGYIYLRQNGYE